MFIKKLKKKLKNIKKKIEFNLEYNKYNTNKYHSYQQSWHHHQCKLYL